MAGEMSHGVHFMMAETPELFPLSCLTESPACRKLPVLLRTVPDKPAAFGKRPPAFRGLQHQ